MFRALGLGLLLAATPVAAPAGTATVPDPVQRLDAAPRLPAAPGTAIELVAPRNGSASACALFPPGADGLPKAAVSPLLGRAGSVPAADISIRYAQLAEPEPLAFKVLATGSDLSVTTPYYDELHDQPRAGSLNPVWITVRTRPDLPPGLYTGTLSTASASVPVRLNVAPWTCPPPREWKAHAGILSSPETLAIRYKTGLWSDAHWALIEKEMEFLAALGSDDLWLSVFSRNVFGHERSWITYTRNGKELKPDLGIVRRYLGLHARIVGKPHAVLLEIWNSGRCKARPGRTPPKDVEVWVDGRSESAPVPGRDGSEEFWAPVVSELRKSLTDLGWEEELLHLGCCDDARPDPKSVRTMQQWAPAAKWAFWTHGRGDPPAWEGKWMISGMQVGHYEHLFCPAVGEERPDGLTGGWNLEAPEYSSCRNYLPKYAPPSQYRNLAEGSVVQVGKTASGTTRSGAGFTRLALDFWPVELPDADHGEKRPLLLLYEQSPWDIFFRNNTRSILAPGPSGPIGTVRFEMLREGMQECEARIAIEQRLASNSVKDGLRRKCVDLLRARLAARESNGKFAGGHAGDTVGASANTWGLPKDWRASALELFTLAAECETQEPR